MAVLAAYLVRDDREESLADYLDGLLAGRVGKAVAPEPEDVEGFQEYFRRYHAGLAIETAAVDSLK